MRFFLFFASVLLIVPPVLCFGEDGHVLVEPAFHVENSVSHGNTDRGVRSDETGTREACLDVAVTSEKSPTFRLEVKLTSDLRLVDFTNLYRALSREISSLVHAPHRDVARHRVLLI